MTGFTEVPTMTFSLVMKEMTGLKVAKAPMELPAILLGQLA